MDQQQADDAQALAEMFGSPGWALLAKYTQERVQGIKETLPYMENTDKFHVTRGIFLALTELLAMPDRFAALAASQQEPPSEEA